MALMLGGVLYKYFSKKIISNLLLCRISLKWEDKRYIEGNEGRITDCKSNHVVWTEANQFWLPNFYVWNARELVRRSNKYEIKDE